MQKYVYVFVLTFFVSSMFSQDLSNIEVTLEKLKINTSLSEISSDFADGNLYYFQNKKAIQRNSEYYDLFRLDSNSARSGADMSNKVSLTKQLTSQTRYHEGPCFIDEINNKIYITVSSFTKGEMKKEKKVNDLTVNKLRLLEGDYINGQITNLKEFTYNDPQYNVAHATYSHSTNRLYFASTMDGTQGEGDIFYCTKMPNGTWSMPVNAGKRVNSARDEMFPYVKNGILFYSSNGQKRQTGSDLDIYYIAETDLDLKSPEPLDKLNSNNDDYGICFVKSSKLNEGFLTSNRGNKFSGNDDIYYFQFKGIKYPESYDLFASFTENGLKITEGSIKLIDENGSELENQLLGSSSPIKFSSLTFNKPYTLAYSNGKETKTFLVPTNTDNPLMYVTYDMLKDAQYKDTLTVATLEKLVTTLNKEEKVIAKVDSLTLKTIEKKIELKQAIKDPAINTNVIAKNEVVEKKQEETIKFNDKLDFKNIYFAYDSYVIYEYSQKILDELIAYTKSNNFNYIVLNAYTDSRGSQEYNKKLSVKRALACREYLINNGIPESQIRYSGFGETNLATPCGDGVDCPESQHKLNRRIEFTLLR